MTQYSLKNNTPANKTPEAEEAYLRANYATATMEEMKAHLGKTKAAIYNKAARMGLRRSESAVEVKRKPEQDFTIGKPRITPSGGFAKADIPIRNSTVRGKFYDGAELRPFEGRPGAMRAYSLPSMMQGRLVERKGMWHETP